MLSSGDRFILRALCLLKWSTVAPEIADGNDDFSPRGTDNISRSCYAVTLRDSVLALRNRLVLECPWSLQCRTRQANASKFSWHATPNT